jgi:hypothetical protein
MVSLYLEDARIGCGFRRYLVLEVGPKFVTLFYAPKLATVRVDCLTFDRHAKAETLMAGIIRANMDEAQKLYPTERRAAVAQGGQALAALRTSKKKG